VCIYFLPHPRYTSLTIFCHILHYEIFLRYAISYTWYPPFEFFIRFASYDDPESSNIAAVIGKVPHLSQTLLFLTLSLGSRIEYLFFCTI
jgi:hypothetical protein